MWFFLPWTHLAPPLKKTGVSSVPASPWAEAASAEVGGRLLAEEGSAYQKAG